MLNRLHYFPPLLLSVTFIFATGCRSPRKGLRVGASTAELKVTMEGLAPEDTGKTAWIYELSGCMSALNGTLSDGNAPVIQFKAPGLKRDLKGCQLRVKVAEPAPDIRPVAGAEPGVLYWASDLLIRNDVSGSLVANAPMQKMFDRTKGDTRWSFSLKIKIKFPDINQARSLTGALQCTPGVVGIGSFQGDRDGGELLFLIGATSEQAYECSDLFINADGKLQVYTAALAANGKFTVTPGGETLLGPLTLTQQQAGSGTPNSTASDTATETNPITAASPADGIQVKTTGTEKCRDNEIFDTEKFVCQPQ